jgi:predicted HD phosphohydrolase
MSDALRDEGADKLRQRIAEEAARMVAKGGDSTRSRFRAARRVARGWVPEEQLPSHDEIRREVTRGSDPAGGLAHLVGDRFDQIAEFVRVLEHVKQDPIKHPEGDVLEHTLQVFDMVHEERPFDEELLTAALVHDVGRAIDRGNPVASGVSAVAGLITERTCWLVESLADATAHGNRTLGARARQRLESHPDFFDVLLLAECDRKACIRGYDAPSLDEALAILRGLAADDEAAQ